MKQTCSSCNGQNAENRTHCIYCGTSLQAANAWRWDETTETYTGRAGEALAVMITHIGVREGTRTGSPPDYIMSLQGVAPGVFP